MNYKKSLNFFNNIANELVLGSRENPLFFPILFYIISLGFPLVFNNFFLLALFVIGVLKRESFISDQRLFLLVLFFLWISASYFWSFEPIQTLHSIPREIHFFVLPLLFCLNRKPTTFFLEMLFKYFSFSTFLLILFFVIRALWRFVLKKEIQVFFYHGEYNHDFGLIPKELNAIYVSVFVAFAFFYYLQKNNKMKWEKFILLFLLTSLFLLSSSIVIFSVVVITFIYYFFYSKLANKMRLRNIIIMIILLTTISFYSKIVKLAEYEIKSNTEKIMGHNVLTSIPNIQNKITIYQAWHKERFSPNDFFPGMAFRVYQFRMFLDILKENDIFWKGLGFNSSQNKLVEKGIKYNVFLGNNQFEGYQTKNFHNQYIQVFAELGIFGLFLLLIILYTNIKNAIKNKDFLHIAFAILMISLFLTESFLLRQRGVAFFVMFYCLFNYKTAQKK